MRAEWREQSRKALGFLCLYIGCVFLFPPSYWGNIWIQLRNWNQKVERLLNPNAKMERVQPPGSCSKKTCPSGRDQATKEHRQGKRWSEQQSPGWGCRSGAQEPGQHAKHPKEQKPSLYERGIPQTAPREVNWATQQANLTVWMLLHLTFFEGRVGSRKCRGSRVPGGMFDRLQEWFCSNHLCLWSAGLLTWMWTCVSSSYWL